MCRAQLLAPRPLHIDRTALAVGRRLDLERQNLPNPGAPSIGLKGRDVDEDGVAAPKRGDEPEAAVVIPLLELSFKSH